MKPLMYGYMRAPDDVPDDELDRTVDEMQRFAETEGYCYAATFFEYQDGSRAAFDELIQELKRAESRHVVVPSLEHLSSHRLLLYSMVERLEIDANAHVLTPSGA
ncbi:hypothetical protein Lesp02_28420 [Lentzea sp. NBRC 105346]|uniref:recombinase family protein n=1 Tax=Lentzea sp. NBRC 105346 TaxID=3032205 RepID=UPI00255292C8|nr:recombinase family protein [Lentzea sp. NBRC 105346]GLZ30653.1 hypothetical protein Lesp02_28420 [Lentzea sp. NBRC 105346]